jgi:hypothetical protein
MLIPNNLDQAITETINMISRENLLSSYYELDEKSFIGQTHHWIGQWIRNNWGFWKQKGELFDHLISIGLFHPDDMSGLILRMTYSRMHNEQFDVNGYVEETKKYWLNLELELE